MAYELHRPGLSQSHPAATPVNPRQPVRLVGTTTLKVAPVPSANVEPNGFTGQPSYAAEEAVNVFERSNVVKAVAGASLGVNARVMVGSINGVLVPDPIAASGHWTVGYSQTSAAAAGEVFSLFVDPREA